jgi:proteasome lid subunit RPN8/RPN11
MNEQQCFSHPQIAQILNNGFDLTEAPPLLADRGKALPGAQIHDWLTGRAREMKRTVEDWQNLEGHHEISSVDKCVVDEFRSILKDPKRNEGEFQWAIGEKDGKLFCSNRFFSPTSVNVDGYDIHLAATAAMQLSHFRVVGVLHSHPNAKGMDSAHYSQPDLYQCDLLQSISPNFEVKSYLLTPDNHLLAYSSNRKGIHPHGEEVGFFLNDGIFVSTNREFDDLAAPRR